MPYDIRHVTAAFLGGIAVTYSLFIIHQYNQSSESSNSSARRNTRFSLWPSVHLNDHNQPQEQIGEGIESTIGNTPLILIKSLSQATGCTILAKCEFLNGAGNSPKDRVALSIINRAEGAGLLTPYSGDTIYEGTVGSTGISLATLARARGYKAHILMPNDQAHEKSDLLLKLGATVERVTPAPIVDQAHFVNRARTLAREHTADPDRPGRGLFADQFETEANWRAHYDGTAPEIYEQCGQRLDAFVAGAGTGGTLSGCAMFLKQKLPGMRIVLADPQGSGLYNKVKHGVMFHSLEREGTRRRQQVDTVVEGIGLTRSTGNFEAGAELIDDAVKVNDHQARRMARWLCEKDGIFCGSSSAVNCKYYVKFYSFSATVLTAVQYGVSLNSNVPVADTIIGFAAVNTAMELGPGHGVVTILCDSGMRHLSKFWKQVGEIGGEDDTTFEELMKG